MARSHVIDSIEVQLEFASERVAMASQARLGELFGTRLKALASDVFDELSPRGETLVVDRLEIDLGELAPTALETDLDERLRRALSRALSDRIAAARVGSHAGTVTGTGPDSGSGTGIDSSTVLDRFVEAGRSDLETLVAVLRDGHPGWRRSTLSPADFDALCARVVREHWRALAALVAVDRSRPTLIERLVGQLPGAVLEKLIERVALEGRASGRIASDRHGASDPGALLASLLSSIGASRSRAVHTRLRRVVAVADVRRALVERLNDAGLTDLVGTIAPGARSFVDGAARRLVGRESPAASGSRQAARASSGERTRFWEFTLVWTSAESGGAFNHRAYMEGVVRRMAGHDNARLVDMLDSLSSLLKGAPSHDPVRVASSSLVEDIRRSERDRKSDSVLDALTDGAETETGAGTGAGAGADARATHGLDARAREDVPKGGTAAAANAAGRASGAEGRGTDATMIESASGGEANGRRANEHRQRLGGENAPAAARLESIREALESALTGAPLVGAIPTAADVEVLIAHGPQRLVDLLARLGGGRSSPHGAVRLPTEALSLITDHLVRSGGRVRRAFRADLLTSIERFAARSADVSGFRAQVLIALLDGKAMDLEELSAGSSVSTPRPASVPTSMRSGVESLDETTPKPASADGPRTKAAASRIGSDTDPADAGTSSARIETIVRELGAILSNLRPQAELPDATPTARDIEYLLARDAPRLDELLDRLARDGFSGRGAARLSSEALRRIVERTLDRHARVPRPFREDLSAALTRCASRGADTDASRFLARVLAAALSGELPAIEAAIVDPVSRERSRAAPLATRLPVRPAEPAPGEHASDEHESSECEQVRDYSEEVFIENAGQALLAPWLPRLFDGAGLLSEGAFRDREAAESAVHLLQHAVDGQVGVPEYRLVLNKVLCGVPQDVPLQRPERIDDDHVKLVELLLRSVCANWPGLGGTSPGALQETFLQREGRLRLVDDVWQLLVEERPFDMLLDRVPWSFRSIRLSWMKRLVRVSWR